MNSLVDFRVKNRLTQKQMSDKLKVSLTFYSKVETGIRNPSFNFIKKFKDTFPNSNVDEIFFENNIHFKCINSVSIVG